MKTSHLLKVVPAAAIALSVISTSAVAGATNRNENTAATPGPKATTTKTPAHGNVGREDMRRGTTNTENIDTPDSASDLERPGSGSAGGAGAEDQSMKHKDKSMSGSSGGAGEYSTPDSSATPGEGSAPENADSGYDAATGNSSGSSTGASDSSM